MLDSALTFFPSGEDDHPLSSAMRAGLRLPIVFLAAAAAALSAQAVNVDDVVARAGDYVMRYQP
ncbi:MAG TPA: hypothetical protein VG222_12650, partial [Vicinamibacterales bacterium]|nr:hypothetical protein [Vicinamibacterales bacterium]